MGSVSCVDDLLSRIERDLVIDLARWEMVGGSTREFVAYSIRSGGEIWLLISLGMEGTCNHRFFVGEGCSL